MRSGIDPARETSEEALLEWTMPGFKPCGLIETDMEFDRRVQAISNVIGVICTNRTSGSTRRPGQSTSAHITTDSQCTLHTG